MHKKFFVFASLLLVATLLSACGSTALAQGVTPTVAANTNQPAPRTIAVTGTGKAFLTPDIAYVNIGVHTENADAAEAVASNNTQTQKVLDALKTFGIADKDIQTTNFSIYPQQQYDNQGKPTGEIKYVVDNTVYVTVRDLSKIGDLLDTVVKSGANSINGVQFDVADRTKALSDARTAAMDDARAQAQELAQAANVKLGPVQSISTSVANVPVPIYAGKGGGAMVAESAANVPVSPGQLTVSVDVSVVYQIQ